MHFTGQNNGNKGGWKAFNSALNTKVNVRNATPPAFIIHTLKSKWRNAYIKHSKKKMNVLHNTEGGQV